jgi:NAD(P)-dependent dehydrogenase (short-subunit alcohol dehydrogenase family)
MRLKNKTAIVFGGANGIGQASVFLLADDGANVVIADRDLETAETVAGIVKERGGNAISLSCDASSEADITSVISASVEAYGGIDALVNCVGINLIGDVEETSGEVWDRSMAVNLRSVYMTCHHAMPHLKKTGGSIVNISSVQAVTPVNGYAAYAAAKGAMISLTRTIAVDFAEDGVRANTICPGAVDTNLGLNSARLEKLGPKADALMDNPIRTPDQFNSDSRLLTDLQPEDIGRVVVFLACDDSSGMTGQELIVDGGFAVNTYNRH